MKKKDKLDLKDVFLTFECDLTHKMRGAKKGNM